MFSGKQKLRVIGTLAALAILAFNMSCTGFFVNPTVTSLAIGPANLALAPATSFQMVATATYSDGSTSDVTGKSVWISSTPNVADFTAPGLLKATSLANLTTLPGTTTVSASDGTVSSSSQTVNVCPVVETLKVIVNSGTSYNGPGGVTLTFMATATFNGVTGNQDVTNSVTWNISNTQILPAITSGSGTVASGFINQPFTVSATLCNVNSNTVTITTTS